MENVPEVIGTNNIKHFAKWLEKLEKIGYKCYWRVLNAKDFGVPQNRERCFMVSILGDYYYNFPQGKELEIKLKDVLEENVDEKCYLSDSGVKYVLNRTPIGNKPTRANNVIGNDAPRTAGTITTSTTYRGEDNYIVEGLTQAEVDEKIYLKRTLCNKLIESGILEENYVINHSYTNGLNGKNPNSRQTLEDYIETTDNTSPTLTTRPDVLGVVVQENYKDLRIRKLTPRECFRLMGVKDQDFDKIAQNQSNASLYHLAGDSIVVDVLMAIFKEML